MKLLALISPCYPIFGGGQLSTVARLRRMKRDYGWDTHLAVRHHARIRSTASGISLETYRDAEELRALALRERPDIVMCSLDGVPDGLRVARRFEVPSIVSLLSFEYCAPAPEEVDAWGVSPHRVYPGEEQQRWVLESADRLVCNSSFLRDRMAERTGARADVAYPDFDGVECLRRRASRAAGIVGVCGHRYKGAGVFLALADAFPRETFYLAGDVDPALVAAFAARANVRILGRTSPRRLFAHSKITLMPSLWPEPFGRVAVESMANGIPTLVSRTGGLTEIVGQSALGVDAFCEPEAWKDALGSLLSSGVRLDENARLGTQLAAPFLRGDSTQWLADQARTLASEARPDFRSRLVAVCGGTEQATAFSMINKRWSAGLSERPDIRVVDVESAGGLKHELPDVTVWQNYAEDFATADLPDVGKLVAVRTWDFGPYPPAWVSRAKDDIDLLVVYSRYVRRHAVASGVPGRRVRVVAPGYDEEVFTPAGPSYPLATKKRFRFLFTGAPVPRKGTDILLKAYGQAFGPEDDVCLVIKDHPHDVFYEGQTVRDQIREAVSDPSGPEVEHLCELLPTERLAALYRACDVGVFPYRAEGFCLPILEMMATGVPSIVPRFGAALDFCSERTSFLMPIRRMSLPVAGSLAINSLGFRAEVDEVEFCETPVDTLATFMRRAAGMPAAHLARRSLAGVVAAGRRFRWRHSSTLLIDILDTLGSGTPTRIRRQRNRRVVEQKRLDVARQLLLEH